MKQTQKQKIKNLILRFTEKHNPLTYPIKAFDDSLDVMSKIIKVIEEED